MLKIKWKEVFKIWLKTTIKELLPIFIQTTGELLNELIETYNVDNLKKLAELKEKAKEIKTEQEKKLNGQVYNEEILNNDKFIN